MVGGAVMCGVVWCGFVLFVRYVSSVTVGVRVVYVGSVSTVLTLCGAVGVCGAAMSAKSKGS